jgi:hypothetical protein
MCNKFIQPTANKRGTIFILASVARRLMIVVMDMNKIREREVPDELIQKQF